jgi:hypothetical protein
MELQEDTWNKSLKIANIDKNLDKGTYLCLRISSKHCSKCVDSELESLKTVAADIGVKKIIILTDFPSDRQMNIFMEEHKLPYLLINNQNLDIGIEKKFNNPYYFVITDHKIQYPFIPIREYPNLFNYYIKNLHSILDISKI